MLRDFKLNHPIFGKNIIEILSVNEDLARYKDINEIKNKFDKDEIKSKFIDVLNSINDIENNVKNK